MVTIIILLSSAKVLFTKLCCKTILLGCLDEDHYLVLRYACINVNDVFIMHKIYLPEDSGKLNKSPLDFSI